MSDIQVTRMKVKCKDCLWLVFWGAACGILMMLSLPFIGGLYYDTCGPHEEEQIYLDVCVEHMKLMRLCCDDPELQGILDYTIQRYNRVGAWDVMFMALNSSGPEGKVIGCNCPWCPGITLDTCLLLWPPEETALVVIHEAMHDYYPYFGHSFHARYESKFADLSLRVSRYYQARWPFLRPR